MCLSTLAELEKIFLAAMSSSRSDDVTKFVRRYFVKFGPFKAFEECFKEVSGKSKRCFREISRVFQESSRVFK